MQVELPIIGHARAMCGPKPRFVRQEDRESVGCGVASPSAQKSSRRTRSETKYSRARSVAAWLRNSKSSSEIPSVPAQALVKYLSSTAVTTPGARHTRSTYFDLPRVAAVLNGTSSRTSTSGASRSITRARANWKSASEWNTGRTSASSAITSAALSRPTMSVTSLTISRRDDQCDPAAPPETPRPKLYRDVGSSLRPSEQSDLQPRWQSSRAGAESSVGPSPSLHSSSGPPLRPRPTPPERCRRLPRCRPHS